MKAYFRERTNHYHIRFIDRNDPDHPEFVESFSKKTYDKKDIKSKIEHINYKIKFQDYDPWQARKKKTYDAKKRYPLEQAIKDFLKEHWEGGQWLEGTKRTYRHRLDTLMDELGRSTPIGELSEGKLQRWLTGRDIAPVTKKSHSSEYNYFFKWLYENGFTDSRWKIGATNVEKTQIRNTKKIKYITYQQLKRIEKAYRWHVDINKRCGYIGNNYDADKYPDAFWFMFWQALRKSELPRIMPEDVKGNKVRIHGKGNKKDWIYMVPPAQKIAKRKLESVSKGRPLFDIKHKSKLYKAFRKACKLALGDDHPTGLHQLRHGGAVHYFSLGKQPQFVSKLLRHENIGVTLRVYADVLDDSMEDVFGDIDDNPA